MTEKFISSDGIAVTYGPVAQSPGEGRMTLKMQWYIDGGDHHSSGLVEDEALDRAVEEFFRDKRDKKLGRWRYPGTDLVVHSLEHEGYNGVYVYDESAVKATMYARSSIEAEEFDFLDAPPEAQAAYAYFSEHRKKEPWQMAQPGEVWVISLGSDDPVPVFAVEDPDGIMVFQFGDAVSYPSYITVDHPIITSGYQLFLKETEDV